MRSANPQNGLTSRQMGERHAATAYLHVRCDSHPAVQGPCKGSGSESWSLLTRPRSSSQDSPAQVLDLLWPSRCLLDGPVPVRKAPTTFHIGAW